MTDDVDIAEAVANAVDFLDHDPSKQEKIEMRKAVKTPSEWLKLLCRDWAMENPLLVETTDAKFLDYKPYLKGLLTSQLLCRLSIPQPPKTYGDGAEQKPSFWEVVGVENDFDRTYVISQVERFCSLYSIQAVTLDDPAELFANEVSDAANIAAAAAINVTVPPYIDQTAAAAAAAAAANGGGKKSNAVFRARTAEKALANERRQNSKREQKRLSQEKKEQKHREREALAAQKANERAAREATREDKRRRKVEIRKERERFANEQKDAALKRAAELVSSNRVPIEITRGVAAAKAAQLAIQANTPIETAPEASNKKRKSAIVVSTAGDLHQIVTHSKNLFAKYSAIAKEHNQKVNWLTVAREIGIHVKVREKYARMHSRAEQRGFEWERFSDWRIKDHPEIFVEPTQAERKAKMPPPPPDETTTVLVEGTKEVSEEAVAAAAAVVDASVADNVFKEEQAAAVAATLVADPTAGSYDVEIV